MSPFCGATDTSILDFWWRLLWVSKPEWVLPYSSLASHIPWDSPLVQHLPTSWQPAWQPSHLFHIPARHWWDSKLGAIMPPLTVWDQADALPTELSRLGSSLNVGFKQTNRVVINWVSVTLLKSDLWNLNKSVPNFRILASDLLRAKK